MTEKSLHADHPSSLVFWREGIAHIKGTRLSVAQIIMTYKQNDCSCRLTADYLEIPLSIIELAESYYQSNSAEIDREIKQREAASEWC